MDEITEREEIENWFMWYDLQCNQYRRCVELGTVYDKDIMTLHRQAETNAARLNEIKE
jgi:predicted P-loop ATPase/GTPase